MGMPAEWAISSSKKYPDVIMFSMLKGKNLNKESVAFLSEFSHIILYIVYA